MLAVTASMMAATITGVVRLIIILIGLRLSAGIRRLLL